MHTLKHWEAQQLAWALEDTIEYERSAPLNAEDDYWADPFYQESVAITAGYGLIVVDADDADEDESDTAQ